MVADLLEMLCGSVWASVFVIHLQSQGAVWTPDFFPVHTQNGQLADCEKICTDIA